MSPLSKSKWVALLGWGSAALKCSSRDRFIGWEKPLQFKRLHLIANIVLIRPLVPDAASLLAAPFVLAVNTNSKEGIWMIDVNRLPLQSEGGLIDTLRTIVDPRKPRGVRHPVVTIVAVAVCAVLSGARSFQAIAEWAQTLGRDTLRQLGSKHRSPPSEPTIRRTLQKLDAAEVDTKIGQWLAGLCQEDGRAIAIDGKTLRGAHEFAEKPPHLLSAVLHQEAVVLGQVNVEKKKTK